MSDWRFVPVNWDLINRDEQMIKTPSRLTHLGVVADLPFLCCTLLHWNTHCTTAQLLICSFGWVVNVFEIV